MGGGGRAPLVDQTEAMGSLVAMVISLVADWTWNILINFLLLNLNCMRLLSATRLDSPTFLLCDVKQN